MHPSEVEFRRRWYAAHRTRFEGDAAAVAQAQAWHAGFRRSADEARRHLGELRRTGDVEAFRAALQAWSGKPDTLGFNGYAGQMLVNQLVKRSDDPARLACLLVECLSPPGDEEQAAAQLRRMVDHVESIRVGGQPAPRNAVFLLSYFWALQDPNWPILWPSGAGFAEYLTGIKLPAPPDERYRAYLDLVRLLDHDPDRFGRVATWWDGAKPVVLDPVLVDRCAFGADSTGADPAGVEHADLVTNAAALVAFARHLRELAEDVEQATGRALQARAPGPDRPDGRPRADTWADWTDGRTGPGIRVWITADGLGIGIKPGWVRPGWTEEADGVITNQALPGFTVIDPPDSVESGADFLYGRRFDRDQLADVDLRAEVIHTASLARPVLDALITRATGRQEPAADPDDPLAPSLTQFREWNESRPADRADRADRERFAKLLAADALPDADVSDLNKIWSASSRARREAVKLGS